MKISFSDKSYIEVNKSFTPGKIMITVAAKHPTEKNTTTINSVEITQEQWTNIIEELQK